MHKSISRKLLKVTFGLFIAGSCVTFTYALPTLAQPREQAKESRVDYWQPNMPAFKDTLSQREIWEIVAYMRAGFPDAGSPSTSK